MKRIVFIIAILLFSVSVFAQTSYSTKNKKAIKHYELGIDAMQKFEYEDAEKYFNNAIVYDPKFVEPYIMLGTMYEEMKNYTAAIKYYQQSLALDEDFFPNTFLIVGRLQLKLGLYEDAKINFAKLAARSDTKIGIKSQAEQAVLQCDFAIDQIAHPKPFDFESMGPAINTEHSEYSPALTADESMIIFTRLIPSDVSAGRMQEDFFYSKKVGSAWTQAIPMGNTLNSPDNEGAHSISPDGQTFYFTACNREGGKGSCDIYMSKPYKGGWDYPTNLKILNSTKWDSQPSIGPDGRTIYFTSARDGDMDIYVSYFGDNGRWSTPVLLPSNINTDRSEMSPFIHPDGQTLYFTSDGHLGMGGFDIFISRKIGDNQWSDPVNIGYPINSHRDEAFLFVSASGETAYFASDIKGNSGMDIYTFPLYEDARPVAVTYLKGVVRDKEDREPLEASFELYELETGELITAATADENGSFLLCIPTDKDYGLSVSHKGYLFYSENFSLSGNHSKIDPVTKNIDLQPISNTGTVVLKNIFFDTDKYELKSESFVELNKLYELMKSNTSLKIEIGGHTDNTGSKEHNRVLSENRAKAVYTYLTEKGIAATRMSFKGYGDSQPIDTNATEEGRANNRRTEFKVIAQ
ncbi:MAG: PD40 domain-containing protein [Bacteroidales bacterium]|nr:PD40 domain-containing protein [Bacteroidales bacterium]